MKQAVDQLRVWFSRHKFPTQQQFWDWMDSYWHKDEEIPVDKIGGMQTVIDGVADGISIKLDLKQDVTDKELATTNKSVVGAINEVNNRFATIEESIAAWIYEDDPVVDGHAVIRNGKIGIEDPLALKKYAGDFEIDFPWLTIASDEIAIYGKYEGLGQGGEYWANRVSVRNDMFQILNEQTNLAGTVSYLNQLIAVTDYGYFGIGKTIRHGYYEGHNYNPIQVNSNMGGDLVLMGEKYDGTPFTSLAYGGGDIGSSFNLIATYETQIGDWQQRAWFTANSGSLNMKAFINSTGYLEEVPFIDFSLGAYTLYSFSYAGNYPFPVLISQNANFMALVNDGNVTASFLYATPGNFELKAGDLQSNYFQVNQGNLQLFNIIANNPLQVFTAQTNSIQAWCPNNSGSYVYPFFDVTSDTFFLRKFNETNGVSYNKLFFDDSYFMLLKYDPATYYNHDYFCAEEGQLTLRRMHNYQNTNLFLVNSSGISSYTTRNYTPSNNNYPYFEVSANEYDGMKLLGCNYDNTVYPYFRVANSRLEYSYNDGADRHYILQMNPGLFNVNMMTWDSNLNESVAKNTIWSTSFSTGIEQYNDTVNGWVGMEVNNHYDGSAGIWGNNPSYTGWSLLYRDDINEIGIDTDKFFFPVEGTEPTINDLIENRCRIWSDDGNSLNFSVNVGGVLKTATLALVA